MPRTLGIGEGTGVFFHSCPLYNQSSSVGLIHMNGETDILLIGILLRPHRHANGMPEVSHLTLPTHACVAGCVLVLWQKGYDACVVVVVVFLSTGLKILII